MPDTSSQAVRSAALKLVEFTIDQLAEELKISTYKELQSVRRTIRTLRKTGAIERSGQDTFRYKGHIIGTLKNKMWRAILVKERFTQEEIVMLSGASRIHVKKFFIMLRRNQIIRQVSGRGYSEGIHCLIDFESAPLECPIKCWTPKSEKKGGELIG